MRRIIHLLIVACIILALPICALADDGDMSVHGRLTLAVKSEGTGDPLSGAIYAIYSATDNTLIDEITTDEAGGAEIELSPGDYYLREQKAARGFLSEPTAIVFEVKLDDVVRVDITSMRDETFIEVPKTGDTPIPLFFPLSLIFGSILLLSLTVIIRRRECAYVQEPIERSTEDERHIQSSSISTAFPRVLRGNFRTTFVKVSNDFRIKKAGNVSIRFLPCLYWSKLVSLIDHLPAPRYPQPCQTAQSSHHHHKTQWAACIPGIWRVYN